MSAGRRAARSRGGPRGPCPGESARRTWARPQGGSPARERGRREGVALSPRGSFIVFLTSALGGVRPGRAGPSGAGGGSRGRRAPRWLRSARGRALLPAARAGQLSGDSRRAAPGGGARLRGCAHGGSAAPGWVFWCLGRFHFGTRRVRSRRRPVSPDPAELVLLLRTCMVPMTRARAESDLPKVTQ